MGLAQFERRLERLVEGVFTKTLRSGLQPVEIARKLTRELDDRRTVGVRGLIAPNSLHVRVSPADHERFASFEGALVEMLADAVREHARDERYRFVGPVTVSMDADSRLGPGECVVTSEIVAAVAGPGGVLVLPDGRRLPIGDRPLVIGRLPECDVPVGDPEVSRRHAEVHRDPDGFRIVDLRSTNGTRVNGVPVQERRLTDGDELRVGTTAIRFEASPE